MACFMATTAMAQNKMVVKTPSGLSTFATTDLTNVAINGNTLTLQSLTDGTLTIADAENISFQKVATGAVNILESQGWQESAYATFALYQGATSYNVYVKGENYADYTKVDQQLVRNYGTYGRVDVVGLKAGNYTLKVVPVVDNSEVASAASETPVLNVVNYDRQGFAHKKWTGGIGAYNNDGTLKQGAKVLYITKNTFNTVSLEMTTSEKSNKTVVTGLGQILKTKQKGYDHTPLAIRIIGEITTADAAASERLSDQGGLLIKANDTDIDMAVTIEGIGEDAVFNGFGLGIVSGSDIEVRNMAVMLQGSSDDNMEVKGAIHVWIHNNDYFYGQKGSGDHGKGDGSLDAKDGCSYATFSYNRYHDSGKSMLCGMKSETTANLLSYHHNWFDHSDSRHPRVRTSTVHVWNNYYDGVSKYGVGATMGSSVFVEANYFRGTKRPMMSSGQGTDATGEGTFSSEKGGLIKSFGNYFDRTVSSFSYYTQNAPNATTGYDAYETATRDEKVPSTETTRSGGTTYNNFDTVDTLMYAYTPDAAVDVPAKVTGYYGAGRLNKGDIRYIIPNTDDNQYVRIAALDEILGSYHTQLVGIFGNEGEGGGTEPGGSEPGGEEPGGGTEPGGGQGGGETPSDSTIVVSFDNKTPSNSIVTVQGNYSNSKGTATYNGKTYTMCVKMESSTTITVNATQSYTMTIVFGDSETASIKINGTKVTGSSSTYTTTIDGTTTLTKADSRNVFAIVLTPVN